MSDLNGLSVTPASEWRKDAEGVVTRLPSGRVARIRDVDLDLVVQLGRVPDALTPMVIDIFKKGENLNLPEIATLKDLQDRQAFRDAVVRCAFVEPRIVDNAIADDEIPLAAVSTADRWFVLGQLLRPVNDLETFRDEQAPDVAVVDASEGHDATGVGDPEPARVGKKKVPA